MVGRSERDTKHVRVSDSVTGADVGRAATTNTTSATPQGASMERQASVGTSRAKRAGTQIVTDGSTIPPSASRVNSRERVAEIGTCLLVSRRSILRSLSLLIAASFTACSGPSFSFRYRLTIEIDTPQGLKSGSSVLETTIQDDTKVAWYPPEARLARRRLKGEAVAIDLGRGRYLIAVLQTGHIEHGPGVADIAPKSFGSKTLDEIRGLSSSTRSSEVVDIPIFITFERTTKPESARIVSPDDFGKEFGLGHNLRSVRVSMTQDKITRSITRILPWIDDEASMRVFGRALYGHYFLQGDNRPKHLLISGT